ncbi:unnamed protein product [Paramecium sonneborni]|uniref:Uncharacterized protein n=1 Tax=Paramecium sonneborni TaxID=65129 RepID=A0A8S1QU66_9CILI|nr:unnamed protein product [Paramecium sonneborni]
MNRWFKINIGIYKIKYIRFKLEIIRSNKFKNQITIENEGLEGQIKKRNILDNEIDEDQIQKKTLINDEREYIKNNLT